MKPLADFLTNGKIPGSLRGRSALLDACRNFILSHIKPKSKMNSQSIRNDSLEVLGMSMERVIEIGSKAAPGKLLETLTKAYAQEDSPKAAPAKPLGQKMREAHQRKATAAKATAAPVKATAPRPAAPTPAPTAAPKAANKYTGTSDSMVVKYFCHELTTAADRAELKAELDARRISIEPNGNYSRSYGKTAK